MEFQRIEILRFDEGKSKCPAFIGRLSYYKTPSGLAPLRAYVHKSGSAIFKDLKPLCSDGIDNVRKYLVETLCSNRKIMRDADFFLAAVWGAGKDRMIDLFKYTDTKNWPGNPDVSAFVFENGVYQPERKKITCGDTLIMLGAEEQFRRSTESLDKYIENCPAIPGLSSS